MQLYVCSSFKNELWNRPVVHHLFSQNALTDTSVGQFAQIRSTHENCYQCLKFHTWLSGQGLTHSGSLGQLLDTILPRIHKTEAKKADETVHGGYTCTCKKCFRFPHQNDPDIQKNPGDLFLLLRNCINFVFVRSLFHRWFDDSLSGNSSLGAHGSFHPLRMLLSLLHMILFPARSNWADQKSDTGNILVFLS